MDKINKPREEEAAEVGFARKASMDIEIGLDRKTTTRCGGENELLSPPLVKYPLCLLKPSVSA